MPILSSPRVLNSMFPACQTTFYPRRPQHIEGCAGLSESDASCKLAGSSATRISPNLMSSTVVQYQRTDPIEL